MSIEPWFILAGIAVLILFFGVYVLFYRKKRFSPRELEKIRMWWQEIESLASHHPEDAVLKADKLLDHALNRAGYSGTLGEKMKKARPLFRDNNGVWFAHKLRNRIAHEMDVIISEAEGRTCLRHFKHALTDLGVKL